MGIREGLLLLLAEEPKHGYRLKTEFEAATGQAWPLNIGQVYTTLGRLERDGLVLLDATDPEGRKIYRITKAGRAEMHEWLGQAVDRKLSARDELSMKILLAVASEHTDPIVVVGVQRAATMTALQDLHRLKQDTDPADLAWLLHLDRMILQSESELRWLDMVEDRLPETRRRRPAGVADEARAEKEVAG